MKAISIRHSSKFRQFKSDIYQRNVTRRSLEQAIITEALINETADW